jgi:hypothetical protein
MRDTTAATCRLFRRWHYPHADLLRGHGLPRLLAMLAAGELQIQTKQRPLAEVTDAWSGAEPSGTSVVLTP